MWELTVGYGSNTMKHPSHDHSAQVAVPIPKFSWDSPSKCFSKTAILVDFQLPILVGWPPLLIGDPPEHQVLW
jgi:hypothetical protein